MKLFVERMRVTVTRMTSVKKVSTVALTTVMGRSLMKEMIAAVRFHFLEADVNNFSTFCISYPIM